MDDEAFGFSYQEKDLRLIMIYFGFDFSLTGSLYLYEILKEVINNSELLKQSTLPTLTFLAERYNVKMKTFSRDVRWAIKKAYDKGLLKYVTFFDNKASIPSTRQVLAWLYHYYFYI